MKTKLWTFLCLAFYIGMLVFIVWFLLWKVIYLGVMLLNPGG